MKKIILGGIAVVVIAAVAAWNMGLNSQKSDLSDISLANVEALAQESSSSHCNRLCEEWPSTYCVLESPTSYIFCFYKYPR